MGEKEKIKQYLDFKGISKNKFYSVTGFSVGFLDSGVSLGADKVRVVIDKYPDLSLEWLVMDRGEMIVSDPPSLSPDTQDLLRAKDELIDLQRRHIALLEEKLSGK